MCYNNKQWMGSGFDERCGICMAYSRGASYYLKALVYRKAYSRVRGNWWNTVVALSPNLESCSVLGLVMGAYKNHPPLNYHLFPSALSWANSWHACAGLPSAGLCQRTFTILALNLEQVVHCNFQTTLLPATVLDSQCSQVAVWHTRSNSLFHFL